MEKKSIKNFILELLVIFIGVSLSFLVNNLNENRKERNQETRYLEGIHRDLIKTEKSLREIIKFDSIRQEQSKLFLKKIGNNKNRINDNSLTLFNIIQHHKNVIVENLNFENLIQSGNLNLIVNYDLKNKILANKKYEDLLEKNYSFINEINNSKIQPFLLKSYEFFEGEIIPLTIKQEELTATLNLFLMWQNQIRFIQNNRKQLLQTNQELQKEIEIYLQ
jgi:hypothetical protein